MVTEPPAYCLPREGGIPVLSPLQRGIERREALAVLRARLRVEPGADPALKAALRNLELLFVEDEA